jgi:hypothetical protein
MLFYTVCFSLGDPNSNLYIYNVLLLYKSLKKSGTFTEADAFIILADEATAKRLSTFSLLKDVQIVIIPKAKSLLDGMLYKYRLLDLCGIPDGTCLTYLDSDMISVRPIHTYLPKDYLLIFPEGKVDDTNYCGDPLPKGFEGPTKNGYSAGFFSYSVGERTRAFFRKVIETAEASGKVYYTLEQVFFNRCLDMRHVIEMNPDTVSFNGHTHIQKCRFINLCGEPGDQLLHFDKMLNTYLSVFA